jgi:hypothetical protein
MRDVSNTPTKLISVPLHMASPDADELDVHIRAVNHRTDAWQTYWTDYHTRRDAVEDRAILELSKSVSCQS